MTAIKLLFLGILLPRLACGFVVSSSSKRRACFVRAADVSGSTGVGGVVDEAEPHFFEYLKFNGTTPSFDVVAKTKDYVEQHDESIYADDYVLRGPVIGPINRKDLVSTQGGFDLYTAFPDIKTNSFGFTQDATNPYRCFYFQKWTGTHTGTLTTGAQSYPATGNIHDGPVQVHSLTWNPEGKVVYESVGYPADRHEGNTEGKAAIFGLFHTAGLKLPAEPENPLLRFIQRLGHFLNTGRSFSREEEIPLWWKSKSRGADPTDPSFSN